MEASYTVPFLLLFIKPDYLMIRAFIQARMSSSRFPGKVLATFRGEPIILHVLRAVKQVVCPDFIVVTTSKEISDDPLVAYLEKLGVNVFRGPLNDVFSRFRLCAAQFPCDYILRISADSPLLDAGILRKVITHIDRETCDLITTIFPSSFPKGQNAELIRVSTLLNIDHSELSASDLEHVTPFYYRNPSRFNIVNIESGNPKLAERNLAVDTLDDLRRIESLSEAEIKLSFLYNSLGADLR